MHHPFAHIGLLLPEISNQKKQFITVFLYEGSVKWVQSRLKLQKPDINTTVAWMEIIIDLIPKWTKSELTSPLA